MKLWIRSQDKKELIPIEGKLCLGLSHNRATLEDTYFIYYNGVAIGTYKTKERALEVLDEIQSIIRGKFAACIDIKLSLNSFKPEEIQNLLEQMAVYEMPEE